MTSVSIRHLDGTLIGSQGELGTVGSYCSYAWAPLTGIKTRDPHSHRSYNSLATKYLLSGPTSRQALHKRLYSIYTNLKDFQGVP